MNASTFRACLIATAILIVAGSASAAPVVWYVDSSATSLSIRATGSTSIVGIPVIPLRMVPQGSTFPSSATPSIPIKLGGSFVADTDFSSSIQFLSGGNLHGLNSLVAEPSPFTGAPGTAPANYAGSVQARVSSLPYTATTDVALRDSFYDLTSAPLAISGGNFAAGGTSFGLSAGRFDFRGYGLSSTLGSGNISVVPNVVSNTSAGTATISGSGSNATLTLPITVAFTEIIAGTGVEDESVTMTFIYTGTLVARTYAIPEPNSFWLAVLGIGSLVGWSIRRHRSVCHRS